MVKLPEGNQLAGCINMDQPSQDRVMRLLKLMGLLGRVAVTTGGREIEMRRFREMA